MRRRVLPRTVGLLFLILVGALASSLPSLASSGADGGLTLLMHPTHVAAEGAPFSVRVAFLGDPREAYELKVWVGSARRMASQAWDGDGWLRGDRYAVDVVTGEAGRWAGWVHARVNPDSAGYPDLVAGRDGAELWVRVRGAGGGVVAEAHAPVDVLHAGASERVEAVAPGAVVVGARQDGLWTALAPAWPHPAAGGLPLPGHFVLGAPAGPRELLALDGTGRVTGAVAAAPPPELLVVEAVPHGYGRHEGGEAVALGAPGPAAANLTGVCLEVSGGRACFLNGSLAPGERVVVARDAARYRVETGETAEAVVDLSNLHVEGRPTLGDAGGAVVVRRFGAVLDALAYGDGVATGAVGGGDEDGEGAISGWRGPPVGAPVEGERLARRPGAHGMGWWDTDGAADWAWGRRLRVGQSDFVAAEIPVEGRVLAGVAPGDSLALVSRVLDGASASIDVGVYLLTSPDLAWRLAEALDRGVRVRVLVDGSPVGGVPPREAAILYALEARGAEVAVLASAPDYRRRYDALHAKYAVVDERWVVVGTENWVESAHPPGGRFGNRGWVVAVENRTLAGRFAEVFAHDAAPRPDVQPPTALAGARLPPAAVAPAVEPPASWRGRFRATPVVAPDSALTEAGVPGFLAGAQRTLDVELLSLEASWGEAASPLVEALLDAARRGVAVRVLLDGTYVDPRTGAPRNQPAVDALRGAAAAENLSLEARLLPPGTYAKVHTKGAVADGRAVLVGSMNWGEASATRNREVGVIVEPADAWPADETWPVAAVFQRAFAADWALAAGAPGPPGGPGGVLAPVATAPGAGVAAWLVALAAGAAWRGRRRPG